jgi:hypothetical protein
MSDGSYALLLVNTESDRRHIAVTWEELGLGTVGEKLAVRDLWLSKELGSFAGGFGSEAEAHGVVLVGIKRGAGV